MSSTNLRNQLKVYRAARGWSQQELAARAGVSRAEISAIEIERVVPSVAASLALAQALSCRIEDLFSLSAPEEAEPVWAWHPAELVCRFWQAEVADRRLLYPAELAGPGTPPHDGVCDHGTLRLRQQVPPGATLVLACCDPAAGLLASEYARTTDFRLLVLPRSSAAALELLGQRLVHLAGVHLAGAAHKAGNAAEVRRRLGEGFSLLHVAHWQEGLAVSPSAGVRSVSAALHGKLRWVGREPGSGARQCLDELLSGREPPRRTARDHRGVAEAIRSGWADAGVCVRLVSEEAGLRFFSVREESYDLCVHSDHLADPRVQALLEVVRSDSYRKLLGELPGYDSRRSGELQQLRTAKARRKERS